jgi:predicted Rossmann fold nucleotide-binding protein DprA/Smf involved in DNA uptake
LGFGELTIYKITPQTEGHMKEIQSLLKIVSDGLKMIAQGVEAVSEKVDEIAKSQAAEEPKVAAKKRAKKPAPAALKKKPARKSAPKTPKTKTARASKTEAAKAPTAAETVYDVISRSQKGVDTSTLMKKTGYDRKKVANMVYKLGKQGKIKTVEKGVYVKA